MAYQKGDIVLVPFPITDLSAIKTRPAVVVSVGAFEHATGAVTVAVVTSRSFDSPFDYPLQDWQEANLRFPSWVRAKLVTLDPSQVRYRPGSVSVRDLHEVDRRLRLAFGV